MHVRTILNRLHRIPGFVFGNERWAEYEDAPALLVPVRPRVGNKPVCSGCGEVAPGYDTLKERYFRFVPFWGIVVFLVYAMRRVNCPRCGVKVERVPWAEGKRLTTTTFDHFVAHWCKFLSWTEAAAEFRVSWRTVFRCVEAAVEWGRKHMSLEGVTAIGIDEIARAKGHKYVTLVYQIAGSSKRLLWVGQDRTEETLRGFFSWFTPARSKLIQFVCSDMWKPYLKVIKENAAQAVQILDRFHIMSHFSKAIDEVRAQEARALAYVGETVLTKTRWLLLKRPENLTDNQAIRLRDLLKLNLRSVRAYLLKEQFQLLWEYTSPTWAQKFLRRWTFQAMRSKLEPFKRVARMIRNHEDLILNWFRASGEISNGCSIWLNRRHLFCA